MTDVILTIYIGLAGFTAVVTPADYLRRITKPHGKTIIKNIEFALKVPIRILLHVGDNTIFQLVDISKTVHKKISTRFFTSDAAGTDSDYNLVF
jgi:hypothetical protein